MFLPRPVHARAVVNKILVLICSVILPETISFPPLNAHLLGVDQASIIQGIQYRLP